MPSECAPKTDGPGHGDGADASASDRDCDCARARARDDHDRGCGALSGASNQHKRELGLHPEDFEPTLGGLGVQLKRP